MKRLRAWLLRRIEIQRARADAAGAYWRWVRARRAYQDTAVIFGNEPGSWAPHGQCGRAFDAADDRMNEYLDLSAKLRRLQEGA